MLNNLIFINYPLDYQRNAGEKKNYTNAFGSGYNQFADYQRYCQIRPTMNMVKPTTSGYCAPILIRFKDDITKVITFLVQQSATRCLLAYQNYLLIVCFN